MIAPIIALALITVAPGQKASPGKKNQKPPKSAPPQKAPIMSMTVNVKDGDTIFGEKSFTVTVSAKNPVTQVEFYVDNELRDTDTSTPYQFKLDTLGEEEGNLKVRFAAYTTEGENVVKNLNLKVDNGIGKGLAFHIQAAKDALSVSDWDKAIISARIAVKTDPKSSEAKFLLARGYMGKGTWDKAQKFAEDAVTADPKNYDAQNLISAINLNKVFTTVNRGGDAKDTAATIAAALKTAVEARRKTVDAQIDAFGPVSDANRLAYADLVMKAGRYSLAIDALAATFRADQKNNEVGNRLAYAYMRMARWNDARQVLDQINKYGTYDAFGYALQSVYLTEMGDQTAADNALREALISDSDSLGVKSAQAYIALKRNRTSVLQQLVRELMSTESQRSEVNYYVSALANRVQDYPNATKYFQRAVLAEPLNYDMYIEAANQVLGRAVSGRAEKKDADAGVAYARTLYEAALAANPSSSPALIGITLAALYQGKNDEALRYGKAAVDAAPQYAAAHYAYSAALTANAVGAKANEMRDGAQKANAKAGELDRVNLFGRELPKVQQAWVYFANGGRTVYLVAPGR